MPIVGLATNREVYNRLGSGDLARLSLIADVRYEQFDQESSWDHPPKHDPRAEAELVAFARDLDGLIVCHGSPRVTRAVMEASPLLRIIGELEGDRFAQRIDVEAAWERRVVVIDTTHGSSYGVAEWALALALVGLRNAGRLFRSLIAGEAVVPIARSGDPGFLRGELSGRKVGLIGCGHVGMRLLELLDPFAVISYGYDPYLPKEAADARNLTLSSLENVLTIPDVIFCLAPLTPRTRGMLGPREIGLIRDDAVFVNVSRGAIVDSDALIERLRDGRLIACLDVFDPEPIPQDSPIRFLPNVFLSPHIAGVTAQAGPRFFKLMVDEFERFFAGHETKNDLLPRTIANRRGLILTGQERSSTLGDA